MKSVVLVSMPNSSYALMLVPLLFLLIPAYSVTGQTGQDNTRTSSQHMVTTDNPTRSIRDTNNVTAQTQAKHSGAVARFELPAVVGAVVLLLILFGASIGISRLVNYCYHRDVNRLDFESKHAPGAQRNKKQKDDKKKAGIPRTSKTNTTPFGDKDSSCQQMTVSYENATTSTVSKVRQEASINNGHVPSDEDRATGRTSDNQTLRANPDVWTVFNKIAPLDLAARPEGLRKTSGDSRPPLVQRYSEPIPKQQPIVGKSTNQVKVLNHQPITDGLSKLQPEDGKYSTTAQLDDQLLAKKNHCTDDETADEPCQEPIADGLSFPSKEQCEGNARTSQMKEQISIQMYGPASEDPDCVLSNSQLTNNQSSPSKEQLADSVDSSVLKEQSSVQIDDPSSLVSDLAQNKILLQQETREEYDITTVVQDVNNYESDKSKEAATTVSKKKKKKRKRKRKDDDTQLKDDREVENRDTAMPPVVESESATPNVKTTLSSKAPKSRKRKRKARKTSNSEVFKDTNVLDDTGSSHAIGTTVGDFLPEVGQVNARKRKLLDILTAERGLLSPTRGQTYTEPSTESFNAGYHVVDIHREKDGTILGLPEKKMGSHMHFKTDNYAVEDGCHLNGGFERNDDVFTGDKHSQSGRTDASNQSRVKQSSIPYVSYSRLRALSMTSSMYGKNKTNPRQNLTDGEQHQICWGSESNDSQREIHDPQEYIKRLAQLRKNRFSSSTKRAVSCTDE